MPDTETPTISPEDVAAALTEDHVEEGDPIDAPQVEGGVSL